MIHASKRIFLLGICMSVIQVVYSQQTIDSIVSRIEDRSSVGPLEWIYLQTSKGVYETGEDLWFKAYQFDTQAFGLSGYSKTLYLQLIDSRDSVVWQEKYPLVDGIASGHVYLDKTLPEGDYFLEGYSRYSFYRDSRGMLPARRVKIVSSISRVVPVVRSGVDSCRFEMFPEGGNLVSGIHSTLAFKATDGKGNPRQVEGVLYQQGEPLCAVKSTHDGMGSISFVPVHGKSYRIELSNGNSYSLPEIERQGVGMRLSKQDDKQLHFAIAQSDELPDGQIYLVGQMRGIVCYIAKAMLKDKLAITVGLDNFLYQGIAEFTLYDANMKPVAERLVYVNPHKRLNITVEPEKENFATREKAAIKIKVTDDQGNPIRAHLGISVYDVEYANEADPVNIMTSCYLSSQIRGRIHNPAYYFDLKNKDRAQAMDLLLMTQGWRRYVWSSDSECDGEPFLIDEIRGTLSIETKKKKMPKLSLEQLIRVSGPKGGARFIWSDSLGRFSVASNMMSEFRGGYMYLKSMLDQEFKPVLRFEDLFVDIDTLRRRKSDYYPYIDLSMSERSRVFTQTIVSQDSTVLLDEVTVTGRGRKPFRDKFMGRLDSLAQLSSAPWVCAHGWLENYMDGYTHHHNPAYCPDVQDNGEPRSAPVIGKMYTIMKAEYYTYNGQWYFKPIDHRRVVYTGETYSEEELLRMNNLWRAKGYYTAREFYQPDEVDMQSAVPDARNTLLWQPSVVTDEKGEVTVTFYCSDINTGFVGVVEGVDGVGLLGAGKCEFRVFRKTNN